MNIDLDELNFLELEYVTWHYVAQKLMFDLLGTGKPFSANDFYKLARAERMPPDLISDLSSDMFDEFSLAGYIRNTDSVIECKHCAWCNKMIPVWERAPA
jgi:hypothetical protein